jgi:hypothetical protein
MEITPEQFEHVKHCLPLQRGKRHPSGASCA